MTPNPNCIVCSSKPQATIKIDTTRVTVKQFRDEVLVKTLNMVDPDVIIDGKGVIVISSEEGETDSNNDKLLSDVDIVDGCILKVDDFFQNYELSLVILHKEPEREGALFEVIADPNALKAEQESKADGEASTSADNNGANSEPKPGNSTVEDSDDDLMLIEDDEENRPDSASGEGTSATVIKSNPQSKNGSDEQQQPCSSTAENSDVICIDDNESDSGSNDAVVVPTPKKRRGVNVPLEPEPKRSKIDDDDDVILLDDD